MGRLFRQICEWHTLLNAWKKVRSRKGAPGFDGMTIARFEHDYTTHLKSIQTALIEHTYRPSPLVCFQIAKPDQPTEKRTLSIPTVIDRIVQQAVLFAITPVLEKRFSDNSFAYRPGRSIFSAAERVQQLRNQGYHWALRADIAQFFDSIDQNLLRQRIRKYVFDKHIQELLGRWAQPVLTSRRKKEHTWQPRRGIPQGAVVSPLLANLYLDRFDEMIAEPGFQFLRYADDLLFLGQTEKELQNALHHIQHMLQKWHLELKSTKTQMVHFDEGFRFLGIHFIQDRITLPDFSKKTPPETPKEDKPLALKKSLSKSDSPPLTSPPVMTITPTQTHQTVVPAKPTPPEQETTFSESPLLRTLYVQEQGSCLSISNQRFHLSKDSLVLLNVPACKIQQIAIFGACLVTPAAIRHCLDHGIAVAFLTSGGRYLGELIGPHPARLHIQRLQFQKQADSDFTLNLARQLVAGKLHNSMALLRHWHHLEPQINLTDFLSRLQTLGEQAKGAQTLDSLLGYEGAATAAYFSALRLLLPPEWSFETRERRPPPDPINALLSLGYACLYQNINALLHLHHLHPDVGYLHRPHPGHAALASDLMEEFRAPVVDQTVWLLLRQGKLKPDNFTYTSTSHGQACLLNPISMKIFLREFELRLRTQVRHAVTGLLVDFRRLIEIQIQQFKQALEQRELLYQPYSPANW